jgi:methylated-DNA-[protein]-cysteine S-methyltransferase
MAEFLYDELATPIGRVCVVSDAHAVRAVEFDGGESRLDTLLRRHYGPCTLTRAHDPGGFTSRLRRYFAGDLAAIDDIPTQTAGTEFARQVWATLRTIPTGTTATYQEIASAIGRPRASRAVGMANGANPVSIIVPCHRVIGSGNQLTGYAGGLDRKHWLLAHEGVMLAQPMTRLDLGLETVRP